MEFIMLQRLQKTHVSIRIDEICKTKEMINQINVLRGMEKEVVWAWIVDHYMWVQAMIERRSGLPIILIKGGCNAQRI
jgi:hypothetical protein